MIPSRKFPRKFPRRSPVNSQAFFVEVSVHVVAVEQELSHNKKKTCRFRQAYRYLHRQFIQIDNAPLSVFEMATKRFFYHIFALLVERFVLLGKRHRFFCEYAPAARGAAFK